MSETPEATDPALVPGALKVLQEEGRLPSMQLTVDQLTNNLKLIQDAMKSVMSEGVDFGKIAGSDKPALYKPGAEKISALFRLGAEPMKLEETDVGDDGIRYRFTLRIFHIPTDQTVGYGMGSCSTLETKYKWRAAVGGEWENTDATRRRLAFKRGKQGSTYTVNQVRMETADVDNTVLKMAKKRALVDGILICTAASAMFEQDLDDMDPAVAEGLTGSREGNAERPRQNGNQAAPTEDVVKLIKKAEAAKSVDQLIELKDITQQQGGLSAGDKVKLRQAITARESELMEGA